MTVLLQGAGKQMAELNLNDVVHVPCGLCFPFIPITLPVLCDKSEAMQRGIMGGGVGGLKLFFSVPGPAAPSMLLLTFSIDSPDKAGNADEKWPTSSALITAAL